jgi:hypothetical protein
MNRAKKSLNRDFADCSMMAEVIHHYLLPSYRGFIEVHNYIRTSAVHEKRDNWNMLNKKVLSKFGRDISFKLSPQHIEAIITGRAGAIESALHLVKCAIEKFNQNPPAYP